jgi:hypothetical protein
MTEVLVLSFNNLLYNNIELFKEMPKVTKCLKCLKLMYSIDYIKKSIAKLICSLA